MRDIFQTDAAFPPVVRFYGCYLLALLDRLCEWKGYSFTRELILNTLKYGQEEKFIDNEVTLRDPQAICDHVVGVGEFRFLGKFPAAYITGDDEFEIVCYHKDGASFNHFASGNGKGIVLYDPWSVEGSDSVRNGTLIGKRIYRRIT